MKKPGGYRLRHRRARAVALRRRAPAHRHRARHPEGRADPDPRRGDQCARRRDRRQDQARARCAARGPHHLHHRAPALDGRRRRPHPGARPGPHRRAGQVPRAGRSKAACSRASSPRAALPSRSSRRRRTRWPSPFSGMACAPGALCWSHDRQVPTTGEPHAQILFQRLAQPDQGGAVSRGIRAARSRRSRSTRGKASSSIQPSSPSIRTPRCRRSSMAT